MIENYHQDRASGFRYLEFLPRNTQKTDVLVIYLHGSGERGEDLSMTKRYGLPALLAQSGASISCPVLCPQLEEGNEWEATRVEQFIEATTKRPRQSVLIGYSLGGSGVCEFVNRHGPMLRMAVAIAAQAPLKAQVSQLGVEFLAIQGEMDPWPRTSDFVDSLRVSGALAESVTLAGKGHYISEEAFFHPRLLSWLRGAGIVITTEGWQHPFLPPP